MTTNTYSANLQRTFRSLTNEQHLNISVKKGQSLKFNTRITKSKQGQVRSKNYWVSEN